MISALLSVALMTFPIDEINAVNKKCYDRQADRWLRFPFRDFLPAWIDEHTKQGTVLDIGAGNGTLAKWLQENGYQVLCLDPSDEMVRRCRAKGLKTIQATIQEYREKRQFDSIFAILSLILVPKAEWPAQVEKIRSLLSERGTFYLAVIEGESEAFEGEECPRFFSYFQKEEVLDLLSEKFELLDFRRSSDYLIFALRKKTDKP